MAKLKVVDEDDGKKTKTVLTPSVDSKIKKRPWRDKVRKLAKKKAKVLEATTTGIVSTLEPATGGQKKKKNRKKRKKLLLAKESEKKENLEQVAVKRLESGRFRFLNEQLYTMTGKEAFSLFANQPDLFTAYHSGFSEQAKKWPNHPLNSLISWLSAQTSRKVVLDLGCGEAKLAALLKDKHEIYSFDLVAVNEHVTACDMAALPVKNESTDIAIFCLSLMGTNLADYLKEAWRCLKNGGILKIIEVSSRFNNINLFCTGVCKLGFQLCEKKRLTDYFSQLEFCRIAKVENKKPFGLKLKPCLYKKR